MEAIFTYSFTVWPAETWDWAPEVFVLFRMFDMRVEKDFTEKQFEWFRSRLNHADLALREISRVPYHAPETVL